MIELADKTTNEVVKTVVLNFSEDLEFRKYEQIFAEMKRHLAKT